MSYGEICPCAHGCRQYARDGGPCPQCLAGWHSANCGDFTTELINPRLAGVDLNRGNTSYCGRCGGQKAAHR